MIIRRAEVQITFIIRFSQDESYDSVCKRAREFLIEYAETIPMLYKELEPVNEKEKDSNSPL